MRPFLTVGEGGDQVNCISRELIVGANVTLRGAPVGAVVVYTGHF